MAKKDTPAAEDAPQSRTAPIDDHSYAGLAPLWQAYTYAQEAGADLWDFALEIDKLYAAGLTISDLRWLVAKGFAVHGQEASVAGVPHRAFCPSEGFFFQTTTCVVLTPRGAAFAGHLLQAAVASAPATQTIETASRSSGAIAALANRPPAARAANGSAAAARKPRWNSTRRELSLGGAVVKRFRVPAPNQELILGAFEEEGWPAHIDDPLPVSGDIDPTTRLHDVINKLNGRHTNPLLRFRGNGKGTGVSWELHQPVVLHEAVPV